MIVPKRILLLFLVVGVLLQVACGTPTLAPKTQPAPQKESPVKSIPASTPEQPSRDIYTVSILSISPAEINTGELITVTVFVSNTSFFEGNNELRLKIDNEVVETMELNLAYGKYEKVEIATTVDYPPGTYSVDVNGSLGFIKVKGLLVKPLEAAFLTLDTELVGDKLVISGDTNLPDGSRLGVSVKRLYKCENDPEWYVGDFAPNNTVTVENGKYSDICVIDEDESWYDWLQNFYRNTGNPLIVKVSDELSVSVIFTPKCQQPVSVYEILGQNAEYLNGEQVRSVEGGLLMDTFYVLDADTQVYFPFTR